MSVKRINTTLEMNTADSSVLFMAGDAENIAVTGQGNYEALGAAAKALAKLAVLAAPSTEDDDWAWDLAGDIMELVAEAQAEKEKRQLHWNRKDDERIQDLMNKIVDSKRLNKDQMDIHCPYCGAIIESDEGDEELYLDGGYCTCPECGKEFYLESEEKVEWTSRQIDTNGIPLRF